MRKRERLPVSHRGSGGDITKHLEKERAVFRAKPKPLTRQQELKRFGFQGASLLENQRYWERVASEKRRAGKAGLQDISAEAVAKRVYEHRKRVRRAELFATPGISDLIRAGDQITTGLAYSPAGLYALATHPKPTLKGMAKQTKEGFSSWEGFRKNLGNNAMLLLAGYGTAASGLSRVGAAGSLVKAGEGAAAAKALLRKPVPGHRIISHPEVGTTQSIFSYSPGTRALQRLNDRFVGIAPGQKGVKPTPIPRDASAVRAAIIGTKNLATLRSLRAAEGKRRVRASAKIHADFFSKRGQHPSPTSMVGAPTVYESPRPGRIRESRLGKPFKSLEPVRAPRVATGKEYIRETADAIARAARIGIFFARPGYLPPNLLGQEALSFAQQGWRAPLARGRSIRMKRALGPRGSEYRDLTGAATGRGIGKSLYLEDEPLTKVGGAVRGVHDALANTYGRVLDEPYRDAAFFFEAERRGYKTPDQVRQLLDGRTVKHQRDLYDIGRRADEAMVNFGRFSKVERDWVNRLVFIYPWLKGSMRYARRFAAEHPVKAAAATGLGLQGKKQIGIPAPFPSYMTGSFDVGKLRIPGLGQRPLAVNPQAAALLGTPFEVAHGLKAVVRGSGESAYQPSSWLAPVPTAALAAFTRTDPFTGQRRPGRQGIVESAFKSLYEGQPIYLMARRLKRLNDPASARAEDLYVYKKGWGFASTITPYFVGSAWPRGYNPSVKTAKGRAEIIAGINDPVERVLTRASYDRQDLMEGYRKAGRKWPGKQLDRALRLVTLREIAKAHARERSKGKDVPPEVEYEELLKAIQYNPRAFGMRITPAFIKGSMRTFARLDKESQAKVKSGLSTKVWGGWQGYVDQQFEILERLGLKAPGVADR